MDLDDFLSTELYRGLSRRLEGNWCRLVLVVGPERVNDNWDGPPCNPCSPIWLSLSIWLAMMVNAWPFNPGPAENNALKFNK